MTTYVDSSVLVAVYVPERFSNAARQTVRAVPQVPFTQLHELEVPNAFELLVGRGSITQGRVSGHPSALAGRPRKSAARASVPGSGPRIHERN